MPARARHSRENREVHFQNAASSPLGRITIAGFGIEQGEAVREPRVFGQYAVVYVISGRGRYEDASGRRKNVETGDLIVLFPEIAHVYNPLPETSWVTSYLCFQGPVFDLWRKQGLLSPSRPILHAEPVEIWSQRLERIVDETRVAGTAPSLLAICRLQQLLAEIVTGAGRSRVYRDDLHWLDRATSLLEADLSKSVDWQSVGRQMGLTSESFRKRFTRLAGQPPAHYRIGRQIDRACELMQDRSLTDRQIAEALGFCDEFYFSRRFKAVTGQSPRQFRRHAVVKRGE